METIEKSTVTVEATVNLPVEKVWEFWTKPGHITEWCSPSDDWHAPYAENDLRVGGRFKTTMAARDGSVSFDFEGTYTSVEPHRNIEYTIDDGRKVQISFLPQGNETKLIETFEAEDTNPLEMQRGGWQAILDNFNSFVENFK